MELEPEVRDWLEDLTTEQFAAAFYVDLLAANGPLLGEPCAEAVHRGGAHGRGGQ